MKYQRGLSLIELMIAVLISSILLLGVLQLFSNTTATDRTNSAMSRVQESGRIALEVIGADARRSGYQGCSSAASSLTVNNYHFPAAAVAAGDRTLTFRYATRTDTGTAFGNKDCDDHALYLNSVVYTRCPSNGVNRVCKAVNGGTATEILDYADITSVEIGIPSAGLMLWKNGTNATTADLAAAKAVRITLTITDARNEVSRAFAGTFDIRNRL